MGILRTVLFIAGLILVVFGGFFALQGAGVIMWPPESFMLANKSWITNGLMIALVGAVLILVSRRIGRTI